MCRPARLLTIGLLAGASVTLGPFAAASTNPHVQVTREYAIKAAVLKQIVKFIEWPAEGFDNGHDSQSSNDERSIATLCILGENPFGDAFDAPADMPIQGRRLEIMRFWNLEEVQGCHLVFISSSEKDRLTEVLPAVSDWGVLTVSDVSGFLEAGGILNLAVSGNKTHIQLNLPAAERAGLGVSAQLIRVAAEVIGTR